MACDVRLGQHRLHSWWSTKGLQGQTQDVDRVLWVGGWNFERYCTFLLQCMFTMLAFSLYWMVVLSDAFYISALNAPGRCLHVSPSPEVFAGNAPDGCIRVKDLEQALQVHKRWRKPAGNGKLMIFWLNENVPSVPMNVPLSQTLGYHRLTSKEGHVIVQTLVEEIFDINQIEA